MLLFALYGLLLFTLPACVLFALLLKLPPRSTRFVPDSTRSLYTNRLSAECIPSMNSATEGSARCFDIPDNGYYRARVRVPVR